MSATTASSLRASLRKQLMLLRHGEGQLKSSSMQIRYSSNKPMLNNSTSTTSTTATAPPNAPKPAQPIPVPNTVAPLPFWQQLGPLTRVAEAYGHSQRKRPYLTQFFSTVAIYLAADISAQRMSGNEHDLSRTARSLTIGGLASIPSFKWFLWLGQSFNFSSRVLSIVTKVAVNQLTFVPIFNSYFFGMQSLLAGDSVECTVDHIKRTVPASFINSCKLWPMVTAINFAFVPLEYRSVFSGVIAVGWQTYLAFLNRQAEMQSEKKALCDKTRMRMQEADSALRAAGRGVKKMKM